MADVFISYARGDKPKAIELVRVLEENGKSVWWDADLVGGANFGNEIAKQIDSARKVIVLWSTLSINSDYVKDEATRAQRKSKLVPVRIEDVELPLGFGNLHTLNWGDGFAPILGAVGLASGRIDLISRGRSNTRLSKTERLILINQYEILKILAPHDAADHDLTIKKLVNGYTDRLFIFDEYLSDELEKSVHDDVFSIFDMHRALKFGLKQCGATVDLEDDEVGFRGFDGNTEGEYLFFASYLLNDERLYQELHNSSGYYNSHMPMLDRYAGMLAQWEQSDDKRNLSKADIIRILPRLNR